MPIHIVSAPGTRTPAAGVNLGSSMNHVSVSAVHGASTKPVVIASRPVLAAAKAHVAPPAHIVSKPKTH